MFGAASPAQPAASGGLFGASPQPAAGGGLFGASQPAGQAAPGAGGGLFGANAAKPAAGGGLFGAPASQPAAGGGLFGAASQPATSGGGLFGASQPAAAPATGGLFGGAAASTAAPAPATGGLFGGAAGSTPAPAAGGLFGAAAQPASGGLFGAASQPAAGSSIFGGMGAKPGAAQPSTGGLFGASAPAQAAGGLFGAGAPALGAPGQLPGVGLNQVAAPAVPAVSGNTPFSSLPQNVQTQLQQLEQKIGQCSGVLDDIDKANDGRYEKTRGEIERVSAGLASLTNALDRDYKSLMEFKEDVAREVADAEVLMRRIDKLKQGQWSISGSLPSSYFIRLEQKFNQWKLLVEKQLDEVERRLVAPESGSQSDAGLQLLQDSMKYHLEVFLAMASQVASLHNSVMVQKDSFTDWWRSYNGDLYGDPFKNIHHERLLSEMELVSSNMTDASLGLFGTVQSQQNPGSGAQASAAQTGGLFATAQPAAGGGLFGASQPAGQAAPGAGGGLFGANAAKPAAGGGLFGAPASQPAAGGGLFGAASQPATSGGGLFGASQPAAAPATGGLFGGAAASTAAPAPATGGLFGGAAGSTPAPAAGGLFGAAAQPASGGLFGAASSPGIPAPGSNSRPQNNKNTKSRKR